MRHEPRHESRAHVRLTHASLAFGEAASRASVSDHNRAHEAPWQQIGGNRMC